MGTDGFDFCPIDDMTVGTLVKRHSYCHPIALYRLSLPCSSENA